MSNNPQGTYTGARFSHQDRVRIIERVQGLCELMGKAVGLTTHSRDEMYEVFAAVGSLLMAFVVARQPPAQQAAMRARLIEAMDHDIESGEYLQPWT